MDTCVEDLERQIGEIAMNLARNPVYDHANTEIESPFSNQITRFSTLCKFKQPYLDSCTGLKSSVDHVRTYKAQMALSTKVNELLYLAFLNTLKGLAGQWFHSLKPWSISDFKQLIKQFIIQFIDMLNRPQSHTQLLTVR